MKRRHDRSPGETFGFFGIIMPTIKIEAEDQCFVVTHTGAQVVTAYGTDVVVKCVE